LALVNSRVKGGIFFSSANIGATSLVKNKNNSGRQGAPLHPKSNFSSSTFTRQRKRIEGNEMRRDKSKREMTNFLLLPQQLAASAPEACHPPIPPLPSSSSRDLPPRHFKEKKNKNEFHAEDAGTLELWAVT
jgi:hypothetical protein